MANILCITFPVEPSETDLAESLVGCESDNKDMYVSYWLNEDSYEWQMEVDIGNWFNKEIVISSIHQLDQAKLLVNLGIPKQEIEECLNTTT